jgi:hypothetical protein
MDSAGYCIGMIDAYESDVNERAMTYLRSGGITARRCYPLRCNASAEWGTGSPAGNSTDAPRCIRPKTVADWGARRRVCVCP